MATSSQITPKRRARQKRVLQPIVKSASASAGKTPAGGGWSVLSGSLGALFERARDSFGGFYCLVARSALEKKESFEDLRAEQKARQKAAAVKRAATSAQLRGLPKELPAPVSRSKA
jgi:hypothetical protein